MTENLGWRSIFFINIPIGIAAIILILCKLKSEWAECKGEQFDLIGSLIYGISLITVMFGITKIPDPMGLFLVLAGIACMIVFIRYEHSQPIPVLNMRLFSRSRVFLFSNLASLINYSATYAVAFLLSLYLQYIKGLLPEYAGLILVAAPAMQMCISPFSGRLSDRVDPGVIASIGMGFTAFGLFLLVFLKEGTSLGYIIGALLILGFGFGLFTSPNTNAIMSAVERKYYGVASGITSTIRLLGQMVSMGIAMTIFAIILGRVEITPEYYPQVMMSVHFAFIVFMVLCVIGIFASLVRRNA
jgi:MFS family permease